MTCIDCIHSDVCFKNGTTPYLGARIACNSVEDLCNYFKNKADFVEVVRCKDCQYAWSNIEERPDFAWCNYYNTAGEDYCPYGAKMDGKSK